MRGPSSSIGKLYELTSRKEKIQFVFMTVLMIINSVLELIGVSAIPGLIVLITDEEKIRELPFVGVELSEFQAKYEHQLFLYVILSLLAFFVLKNLFAIYLNYKKGKFARDMQIALSNRLMNKLLNSSYEFHLSSNSAELIRNINNEIPQIINNVVLQILNLIMNGFIGIALLMLMFTANPAIAAGAIIILGVVSFSFLKTTRKKINHYGNVALEMRKHKNFLVIHTLNLIKEIKILGREPFFSREYDKAIRQEAKVTLHKSVTEKVPRALLEIVTVGLMLGTILYLVYQNTDTTAMVTLLALFAVAAARLMPVISEASTAITNIRYSLPSIQPLYYNLHNIKDEVKTESGVIANISQGSIKIKDLHFRYKKSGRAILHHINLEIPLGSTVAFVGPSGAGKSTLVDILLGILKVRKGTVYYNDTDISTDLVSWRKKLGYVPQMITLIDGTILSNICLGISAADIDMERVNNAVELAQLKSFIESLPEGLSSPVGERGLKLSGGQRQRLGIARALYNDPSILVMDEATAALDNLTEKYVVEAIDHLKGNRTIVMIAHRLTTVENCDIIFFLVDGKIVDRGSYEELLSRNQEFQKMALVE